MSLAARMCHAVKAPCRSVTTSPKCTYRQQTEKSTSPQISSSRIAIGSTDILTSVPRRGVPMSRPDSTDSSAESRGPLPYELYVRLGPLAASWPTDDDGGPGSVVACCGFQAAELTLRLIGDALEDERPAAFPQQRIARFVEHLVDGLEVTCRLLRHSGVPEIATTTREDKAPSPGFAVLSHLERDQVDQVTRRFAVASAGLPFEIGIEGQLEAVRRHQRLPAIGADRTTAGLPVLDYTAVVAPETVFALREPTPYGPEDHLFSTAHQITECWLHIAHHLLDLAA